MRGNRIDRNQNEIVSALRKLGFSVAITSMLGKGFPDIVVGKNGRNWLFELKDNEKSPSQKKLTIDEEKFFASWRGQVNKVESIDEILKITLCLTN